MVTARGALFSPGLRCRNSSIFLLALDGQSKVCGCSKFTILLRSVTEKTVTKGLTTLFAKTSLHKFSVTYIRNNKTILSNPHRVLCNTFLNIFKSEGEISTILKQGVKIGKVVLFLCEKHQPLLRRVMMRFTAEILHV